MPSIGALVRHSGRAPEILAARRVTPAWRSLLARYFSTGHRGYPIELPLAAGGRIRVSGPEELKVFWHVFVRRCYSVQAGCRVIVDAGANIGLFSVWAAREAPAARIIALEPSPATFRDLRANISANALDSRIQPLPFGLAGETGERELRAGAPSPNRSMLLQGVVPDASEERTAISCVSLADLLERERLADVDLLKMDIEGSEWEVLFSAPPAVLKRIRRLELEYHEVHRRFGYTPERLFAHLEQGGLQLISRVEDRDRTGIACFRQA